MIQQLIAQIREALHHMPEDSPGVPGLRGVMDSLNLHIDFLGENPELLFQCLWNDLSASQLGPELKRWRQAKQQVSPRFHWIERLNPERPAVTRRAVQILSGHENRVFRAAFSPDGTKLASAGEDLSIMVWDVELGIRLLRIEAHKGQVTALTFLSNGDLLSGSSDRSIKRWNSDTGELLEHFVGLNSLTWGKPLPADAHAGPVTGICVFRDEQRFISSAGDTSGIMSWKDRTARIWDFSTGKEVRRFSGHEGPVWGVGLNHDESLVATCSSDGTVRVWETASAEVNHVLHHGSGVVGSLCWHPTRDLLWSGDARGTVREWDSLEGTLVREFQLGDSPVTCLAAHPTGVSLLATTMDGECELIELAEGARWLVAKHPRGAFGVAWSPDGSRVACASADYTVSLTSVGAISDMSANGFSPSESESQTPQKAIEQLTFTPGGKNLVLVRGTELSTYDLDERQERVLQGQHENFVTDLCALTDELVATASHDRTVKIWSISQRRVVRALSHGQMVTSLAFSPANQLLATGSFDKLVRIWNPSTGDLIQSLAGHDMPVHDLVFSSDGSQLVSVSGGEGAEDDNTVRVWDVENGDERSCLHGHFSPIYAVGISPDGRFVASGSGFGVFSEASDLILWDLRLGRGVRLGSFADEKRIIKIAFSKNNPIVMTLHDREYGELGEGVASRTGNRYVTRFWDLTEFVIYREFDAVIDIDHGVARMGDGDWLGVAKAKRFYAHHLHTFSWLPADERMHLVAHHPSLPLWAGADGDSLVICAYRQG